MHILVTGNRGYIGAILVEMLLAKKYKVTGYDTGYYEDCALCPYSYPTRQIKKDIRDVEDNDLKEIDAIIHLAALSNDPLGELASDLTEEINLNGTIKLAQCAKRMGVSRFIYSSSQSMYGISPLDRELEEDSSKKNPLTVYARTKWQAECALKEIGDKNFHIICFRPSTVFGVSPVLRCDIVFNNLVACAYTTGTIEIKSDGTPWRPVVHVRDVSSAYIAGLEAPLNLVSGQAFNVGILNGNFTVRDLALAAQRSVPGSTLVFTGEHGNDSRTYRVSFEKILTQLKNYFKPEWDLDRGGVELVEFFKKVGLNKDRFWGRECVRLKQIHHLCSAGKLNENLRWAKWEF